MYVTPKVRRLALQIGLFAITSGIASAQIALVHVTSCGPQTFPTTTCSIPSSGAGNLLVVAWTSNNGGGATTIAGVTDNVSNSYVQAAGARAVDSIPNTMIDMWYAKNTQAGATVLTITPNPTGTRGTAVVWEFSGADTSAPLDQTAVLNSQIATTTPLGAPVTTSSTEAVVSVANVQGTISALFAGNSFMNDSTANGNGWAHLITSSAGTYQAQWTNGATGTYASSTASFKAAVVGGPTNACDLAAPYGSFDAADVQAAINMTLGISPCTANIGGAGVCNAAMVQRVVNAALSGGTCVTTYGVVPHYVSLSWTASVTPPSVTYYNVYRSTTLGVYPSTPLASVGTATTFTDYTVQAGVTYFYVVTAVSGTTESGYSTPAQATVGTP